MRAIEIKSFGGPEVLTVTDRAQPTPQKGQVLIAVKAAGVNRPDIVQRQGFYPAPPGESDLPGLEIAGEIEALGEGVEDWKVGDKVCALVAGGGYAEYCTAPQETLLPIPDTLDYTDAAGLPETFFTVWSNLFMRAGLKSGEWVLVHGGSSGIGYTAIQLAKAFGAKIITTAGSAEKCAFCTELGADLAINYRSEDWVQKVKEATSGKGVNLVLDMVGGDYINKNIECMAVEGRHISIAFLSGPQVEVNMLPVMLKRLTLGGSTLRVRERSFKQTVRDQLKEKVWPLLSNGSIKPVVHRVFNWSEASKAHQMMEDSSHMGKIILKF